MRPPVVCIAFATVVIVLGAIAFLMGLIMVALTSDPDFSM